MIGAYGEWAAQIAPDPPRLSLRRGGWESTDIWKRQARQRYRDALLQPDTGSTPQATVQHHIEFDGLAIEHLTWQLPYGPPTEAVLLKPAGATGRLPAVLGLHDHGGNKYFGLRKITRIGKDPHPLMLQHQEHYYGGVAWANELAKRGYVVLVHDAFAFASRRVRVSDLPDAINKDHLTEKDPESEEEIQRYNAFASNHEHLMAKSLFSAGTTWPGVFTSEDQRALDYLCSREDVDAARVGCCGLSGGGLRTVYLTGADARIKCSCCAGMMTTWRDYLLNKCYTHTWMIYIPGLPRDLDYPEILGLNLNPVMVLNNHEDELFTVPEMERADRILGDVYRKAGAADRYRMKFYAGPHKFDRDMQSDAFQWFDRWLKS